MNVGETVADGAIHLRFAADGAAAAVFHVYDRTDLTKAPRRFTVEPGCALNGRWAFDGEGLYDLWVLGPNGFHRHFMGHRDDPAHLYRMTWVATADDLVLRLPGNQADYALVASVAAIGTSPKVMPLAETRYRWPLRDSFGWYDVTVSTATAPHFRRRVSGRIDAPGRITCSDPFVTDFGFDAV